MLRCGSRLVLCSALLLTPACASPSSTSGDEDTSSETTTSDESTSGADDDGGSCVPEIPDDCMDPTLKCMPWAESMGAPEAHQCCPLDPSPVSAGESCHVQEYVHSCIDDCGAGSMCLVDDIDALSGYCHEFCEVTDPGACGVDAVCMPLFQTTEAVTPLCLLRCDPLLQDCAGRGRAGWTCIPTGPLDPNFVCLPPTLPVLKIEFEDCMIPSDCAAGLTCVPATQMLGCEAERCCTSLCDVTEQPGVCTMGNECISLESDVPGTENVGVCLDPSA